MDHIKSTDYTANTVFALGLLPGLVGLNSLLRPGHALSLLGFPAPPEPEGQKLAHSLIRMSGVRTLTMSLTTIAVWCTADRRTLGYVLLSGIPVALIDGFISRWQIEGMEWGHWIFVPVSFGLGARLVGWF